MEWLVITIKPNQSIKAESNLIAQGFKPYFPKVNLGFLGKIDLKDLFPGYAFVKCDSFLNLSAIDSTRGVKKVMRVQNKIPTIQDQVIQSIKKQIASIEDFHKKKKEFEVDDRVLINLKILSDQEGEIIDILDKGSSKKFLLKILNSNHAIWVNQDDIHHI